MSRHHELVENHGRGVLGSKEYQTVMKMWQSAYPNVREQQQVVATGGNDVFVMSIYEVENAGKCTDVPVAKSQQMPRLIHDQAELSPGSVLGAPAAKAGKLISSGAP